MSQTKRAIALGFFIGALSMYSAGVRKGRGEKKNTDRALKEMKKETEIALAEADKERQALMAEREADSAALKETLEKLEEMDFTERQKIAAKMYRKGFKSENIRRALNINEFE